jgi:DNA-directed RNA polymerase specialized sigma subunit
VNIVTNEQIEEALKNEDYQKIMAASAKKFYGLLSQDELESCKLMALWNALKSFDSENINKNGNPTKFTTYLFSGVFLECRTMTKFVMKNKKETRPYHPNIEAKADNGDFDIELLEELNSISDGDIIKSLYVDGETVKEISKRKNLSKQAIYNRKEKALKLMRSRIK